MKKYNRILVIMNRFSKITYCIPITMNITSKELTRTYENKYLRILDFSKKLYVVTITRWNGTCSLLTSTKLSIGYLVVEITRELNKKPSLHCYPIYINYIWSILQQCPTSIPTLKASCLSHVYSTVTVQDYVFLL